MITVSVERHVKDVMKVLPVLRELRTEAMHYPGYLTGQTLIGAQDRSLITVVTTWETIKDWTTWEASERRVKLYKEIEPYLLEQPKVMVYRSLSYGQTPRKTPGR